MRENAWNKLSLLQVATFFCFWSWIDKPKNVICTFTTSAIYWLQVVIYLKVHLIQLEVPWKESLTDKALRRKTFPGQRMLFLIHRMKEKVKVLHTVSLGSLEMQLFCCGPLWYLSLLVSWVCDIWHSVSIMFSVPTVCGRFFFCMISSYCTSVNQLWFRKNFQFMLWNISIYTVKDSTRLWSTAELIRLIGGKQEPPAWLCPCRVRPDCSVVYDDPAEHEFNRHPIKH